MLFLGAGASMRFGVPTMEGEKGLSGKFEKEVIENNTGLTKGEQEVYLDIKNILGANNLENILTVLNDLSEELRNPSISYFKFNLDSQFKKCEEIIPNYIECLKGDIKQLEGKIKSRQGGRPRRRDVYASSVENMKEKKKMHEGRIKEESKVLDKIKEKQSLLHPELSENLKSKIIEFIRKNCDLNEKNQNDIIKTYNQLFAILKYDSHSVFKIFTTNYDRVIETYFESKDNFDDFYDGFTCKDSRICDWRPEGYDEDYKIKLFKLHGSIDQFIENGRIIKCWREPIGTENAMIYPMREKEVYKDPFFELFIRLKTSLLSEKICIVIGYSFGDEHIQNVFFDAVKRNPEIKILFGNKNPDEVIKNLEPIKDNIIPIEGEFGKETFFERLEEEIEKCKSSS